MGDEADWCIDQGLDAWLDHGAEGCDEGCEQGCPHNDGVGRRGSSNWLLVNGRWVIRPECPYCGKLAQYRDSVEVYKTKSYGMIWMCPGYPTCDAYVGAHKNSVWPLGRLADAELRKWKKAAHAAFDTRWQMQVEFGGVPKGYARSEAYRWLQKAMGLPERECHIGRFDVEQCKKVVEVCK